jgi:Tfp pilus assembly protein PilN
MRNPELQNIPVIEWSSSRVTAYNPQNRQYHTAGSIAEAVQFLQGARGVVVALSRRSSFLRTLRVPDSAKAQVRQVLQLQLNALLPATPGGFAFDFRLTKSVNGEGRLAVVAAVANETLRQIHRELKAAGVEPIVVVPTAFGSWLLSNSLNIPQCAVVENVTEGLAIDIIADDELRYTRVVPLPKDSEAIEAEICRTFSIARVPCSHIVASAGFTFDGADTTVATRPLEVFSTGLLSKLELNIELPETLDKRRSGSLAGRARIAIVMSAVALGAAAYVFMDQASAAAAVQHVLDTRAKSLAQLKSMKSTLDTKVSDQTKLQARLAAAFQPVQNLSDVVVTFSTETPPGVWLNGITLERGKPLQLRGTAMTSEQVAQYVQLLSTDERFRQVRLVFANDSTIEKTPVVQFSISAHVLGNLPLSDPFGAGKK